MGQDFGNFRAFGMLHADDWLLAGAAGLASGALASLIMWRRRVRGGDPYRAQRSPDT